MENSIEDLRKEVSKLQEENTLLSSELEKVLKIVQPDFNILSRQLSIAKEDNERLKSTEEALHESEERLRLFYENTNIGIYRTTPDGRILMANPALIKMLRYNSFNELSERNLEEDGFEPNYSRKVFVDRLEKNGEIFGMETQWKCKNGEFIWVRENAKAIRNKDGRTVYFDGTVEHRYYEEKLATERNLLRTLIDALPDSIFAKDAECRFILNNIAHIRELGASFQEEILGKTDEEFRPREFIEGYRADDEYVLKTGQSIVNREEQAIFSDGAKGWILSTKVPLRDLNNKIIGLVGNSRDITERKRAEEALRSSEKQLRELNITKDKFFSIIAHDLRSPFQGLLGLIEMLVSSSEEFSQEELMHFYQSLHKSAFNLYDLLENLLEWSMMQRGMIKFKPEVHDLKTMIDQNFDILKQKADQKEIQLINKVDSIIEICVDERMINTVFRNLITNAVKFTPRKGQVNISAKGIEDDFVEIYVADTGVGIPQDTIAKLFRVDEKISTLGTENEPSTGLGLLLCKDFIEKHKGTIRVESELKKGSNFIFTLPKNLS